MSKLKMAWIETTKIALDASENDLVTYFKLKYIIDHGKPFKGKLPGFSIMVDGKVYKTMADLYTALGLNYNLARSGMACHGMTKLQSLLHASEKRGTKWKLGVA